MLSYSPALILIIWFRTDAFLEYCRLFKLNFISNYKDYDEKRHNDVSLTYHSYLRQYHNTFFIRLITCPICINFWIAALISPLLSNIMLFPVIFINSLILFTIVDRLLG